MPRINYLSVVNLSMIKTNVYLKCNVFLDIGFDELKQIIDVNLNGTLHCSKLAIDIMKELGNAESHIIMINRYLK